MRLLSTAVDSAQGDTDAGVRTCSMSECRLLSARSEALCVVSQRVSASWMWTLCFSPNSVCKSFSPFARGSDWLYVVYSFGRRLSRIDSSGPPQHVPMSAAWLRARNAQPVE